MISIIVPYKNPMPFFEECIDSILNQSYTNFQLLLVNDHSCEASKLLALKYANKDSRVNCLENEGNGIIEALITGAFKSKGNFITRMDADDLMRVDKLQLMRNQLISKGEGHVCIGGVKYFASGKKLENGYIKYENWLNKLTFNEENFSEIFKECIIPSSSWMIYSNDFKKINQFNNLDYPEDYDFAFRLWTNNFKITSVKEKIHLWRDHHNRTSRNSSIYTFENFMDLKLKYIYENEKKSEETIVLWGAGKKGKTLAKKLINKKQSFYWITENIKKINKEIYDVKIDDKILLEQKFEKLIICCISDPLFKIPTNNKMNRFISFY